MKSIYFHSWGFGIGRLHVTWSDLWLDLRGYSWLQTHGINVVWMKARHPMDSRQTPRLTIGGKVWRENP
jgi:hypothetical protein